MYEGEKTSKNNQKVNWIKNLRENLYKMLQNYL